MPPIWIDSADDPRLAPYQSLKRTNATRWGETFVVEGDKLVERLLASRYAAISLLSEPRLADRFAALAPPGVPVYVLSRREIESLVGFNFHRGALACGRRAPQTVWESQPAPPGATTLVICPHVDDPENLGAIFRNAWALGADGVLLGPTCADPLSRRALRVSMGASLLLDWETVNDVPAALIELRRRQIDTIAAVLDDSAELLDAVPRPARLALVLGGEAHGLAEEVIAACARRVTIPMAGGADSLNVAAATGILLYHFRPGRARL